MNIIEEHRHRPEQRNGSSHLNDVIFYLSVAVLGISAYVLVNTVSEEPGIAGVVRDRLFDQLSWSSTPSPSIVRGKRLGRADVAPLLKACADRIDVPADDTTIRDNPDALGILMRLTHPSLYLEQYGPFIECAMQRYPAELCDPDNRAMVVDAVIRYMRADDRFKAEMARADPRERAELWKLHDSNRRDRILDAVDRHRRAGRLIRGDFGFSPHPDIKAVFGKSDPIADSCKGQTAGR